MDFKKYDDLLEIKGYDGFISPDGCFYRVRKRRSSKGDHNLWAEQFIKEKYGKLDLNINRNSLIFSLSYFNGPSDILVHLYKYIYYSHDIMYYKPIVKLPDKKLFNNEATGRSLDMLFQILLMNNEEKAIESIFDNHEILYSGLDDNQKTYRI